MKKLHLVTRESILTGVERSVPIEYDLLDYANWIAGGLIQNCMPYLSPSDREFLMTGIVDSEWDSMGGDNER